MIYVGSKRLLAKDILPIMLNAAMAKGITTWVEPFVGGANIIDKVPKTFRRIGIDLNPHTIAALIGIRDHAHELPSYISKEEYEKIRKENPPPHPVTSWVRFAAAFSGRFDEIYSERNGLPEMTERYNSSQRQSIHLQGVELIHADYTYCSDFKNCLIYCDPPYKGAKKYKCVPPFNHDAFFDWCRKMSEHNLVYISEYQAPEDFQCVWAKKVRVHLSGKNDVQMKIEKLFTINNAFKHAVI